MTRLTGSVGGMFRDAALSNPDGIALMSGQERVTYRDLDADVDRLANALAAKGVTHGDSRFSRKSPGVVSWSRCESRTRLGFSRRLMAMHDPTSRA